MEMNYVSSDTDVNIFLLDIETRNLSEFGTPPTLNC